MQIIIVQAEIEQAIRNHILEQINVKDGMRIDIDLKATRGAEGTTAIIDIVPVAQPAAPKAEAPIVATKPVVIDVKKAEPKQEPVSQGKAETTAEQPPVEDMTETSVPMNTPEAGAEPSSTEPESTPVEAQAEEVKPAGRSLFNGLKRVNNG